MTPPAYVIEAARQAAMRSPCAKSKRGAALFNRETADHLERHATQMIAAYGEGPFARSSLAESQQIVATGFNGQPLPFTCSGTDACKHDCGKLCLHAEERAIRAAGALDDVADLELVHVKVIDGKVVAGGGPSCWQCSRLVVEVKLRGVWLFELRAVCPHSECPMCIGAECNRCHAGQLVDGIRQIGAADGAPCEHDVVERHTGYTPPAGEWRFYGASEFHAATLRHERIGDR